MLSYPNYSDFDTTLLVRECGKMEALDRLLVKLHATGHRVLLFSTMTKVLFLPHPPLLLFHMPTQARIHMYPQETILIIIICWALNAV